MPEYIEFPNPAFEVDESEDIPEFLKVRAKYEVCPTCRGKGSHVNRAIDGNGLTREDFDENPGFFEDYMSGVYDVPCEECNGLRVVLVADQEYMEQNDPHTLELYNKYLEQKNIDDGIWKSEIDFCYGRGRW